MSLEKNKYKIFGRLRGRKKKLPLDNYKNFLLKSSINLDSSNYNILDIGSGSGESSIYLANKKPFAKIIACDLFEDGNINLLNEIMKRKIDNVNLFKGNVKELIDNMKINKIFDEIWILFPDPWPKLRHHKRRLINNLFLKQLYLFLKKNAKIYICSDSPSYIQSILFSIHELKKYYLWENQRIEEWDYEILNLPDTKFFKKAKKLNKKAMIIQLKKI